MPRLNAPLLAWNRGIVSKNALARVDVDRIRLSCEEMTNWTAKAQGSMHLRAGLEYIGSSYNDLPAQWIDFVASTTDTALLEMTDQKMRVWINDALITRPTVSTTISNSGFLTPTGWNNNSTGGAVPSTTLDLFPVMTSNTTSGVTMTASTNATIAFRAADDKYTTYWNSTTNVSVTPQWVSVNFGSAKTVSTYSVRASTLLNYAPRDWKLQGSSDNSTWNDLDTQAGQTGWASQERRVFTVGSPTAYQYYRILVSAVQVTATPVAICELEMSEGSVSTQAAFGAQGLVLNATAVGSYAKVQRTITVPTDSIGIEHALRIAVARGPVTFRCGSSTGDDDYITETTLFTGVHSLAFTPTGDFSVTFQSGLTIDKIITSCQVETAGTLELPAPYLQADLINLRWDQSADVVFVACSGYRQKRIERRASGRSWSLVDYVVDDGALYTFPSTKARLKPAATYGNTTLSSDVPFFKASHVGAVFSLFHEGTYQTTVLGAEDTYSPAIRISGIYTDNDISYTISGTWTGTITLQHSYDGATSGFLDVASASYTTNGTRNVTWGSTYDNVIQWVRLGFKPGDYTSGAATVLMNYKGNATTGFCRVTGYNSPTSVNIEVLSPFGDVIYTDNWREAYWSDFRGWPTAVSIYEGRMFWSGKTRFFGSISDSFDSYTETKTGDAGPIVRSIGTGPVDTVNFMLGLTRLVLGTAGAEISVKSSTLDEPLTPTNSGAKAFSTNGSSRIRAAKVDNRGIYINRSNLKAFELIFDSNSYDYKSSELTILSPDIMNPGVIAIGVQRAPDTRLHFVLSDGTVTLFAYEPEQQITCFSKVETSGFVENVVMLPGVGEDRVYYHVRRTVNGVTKRYLEKYALESECHGGTVNKQADCFKVYSQAASTTVTGLGHLEGLQVCVWNSSIPRLDMDGNTFYGDAEMNADGTVKLFTVTGGQITGLSVASTGGVIGLQYTARFKSSKLAYAAGSGTALVQPKRVDHVGVILGSTHKRGISMGGDYDHLLPLKERYKEQLVPEGYVFPEYDDVSMEVEGSWDTDSRLCLQAQAPRPAWLMACVLSMSTNDKL